MAAETGTESQLPEKYRWADIHARQGVEQLILCPRKNPKIQESCKNKAIRRTGVKGQLKNARRNKKRLGFNLPPPSLCFFGFSNGLSIHHDAWPIGGGLRSESGEGRRLYKQRWITNRV